MTKKIFRSIVLVAASVLLASLVIILSCFYDYFARLQKQQLKDELDAVQKKLDEETALNDQLLQATQDEQSDAKQELRDKEQELDHTRLAYEALLTAMNCDTHEGNVTFSRAMETVARYQECLSENALAEFEKLQEQ